MTSRVWRCERGEVALTSVLAGMSIMLVVGFAILTSFEAWTKAEASQIARNEAQDRARSAVDRLARELRNLASPTPDQPQAVDRVGPFDLVFQTVDPVGPNSGANVSNVRRVRYCLDTTDPSAARLWTQEQRWTTLAVPAMPSSTACPAAGWNGGQRIVADRVTNARDGLARPVFVANSATLTDISALHAELFVDMNPAAGPVETRLASGVFLRNQNRRPVAAFSATRTANGIVLNGSASADPEGQTLVYRWFDGTTQIGTGVTFTYEVASGTARTIGLTVEDPAGLTASASPQVVP